MSFQLKKGSSIFDLELDGKVSKAGADAGRWSVTKDKYCRILITKSDGTQQTLDVNWKFEDNQLRLYDGTTEVYNFQNAGSPKFNVSDKAVLQVFPKSGEDFNFELRGEWDLTSEFDLSLSINGSSSVIDGYVDNNASIFEYWFGDNKDMYRLNFTGQWDGRPVENGRDGSVMMSFWFEREDGSRDEFSLPASATFNRTINQFQFEFQKADGVTNCKLTLAGLINVGKDSRITYAISAQKQGGTQKVFASEIKIAAVMVTDNIDAALEIKYAFMKKDGTVSQNELTISGQFKFDKASLQIVFRYSAQGKSRSIFFGGKLKLDSTGTTVEWAFKEENNVRSLTITIANVSFHNKVTANSLLVVSTDGGTRRKSIKMILGVTIAI
jgi:hypothetical protein